MGNQDENPFRSDGSDSSDESDGLEHLLPKHGGYRKLRAFHAAEAAYDATLAFCDRFIEKRSRTHDQMVQAARSGSRNISEGSVASGTSKKPELKLTNIARASLEELMGDYEEFLTHRHLPIWDKNYPRAIRARRWLQSEGADVRKLMEKASPEVAANTMLCLINQASYLIHRQLDRLARDFVEQGRFTERLYRVRSEMRRKQSEQSDRSDKSDKNTAPPPACPRCGKPMRQRTARQGPHAGKEFWGCSGCPECRGIRAIE